MALSYAGVRLPVMSTLYREWLDDYHSLTDFHFWSYDWNKYGLDHLPIPSWSDWGQLEIGTMYWPTGLSRCGVYCGVVDSAGLLAVQTALGQGSAGPAPFVMTTARLGSSRTFSLRMLPPRPLAQIANRRQAYLITLVDARYFLREALGSVTSTPASWSDLLSALASQLGITLTPDSIDADYGAPTDLWLFNEKPLAPVLDAVCSRIGHRLVANLDGTFQTQRYTTARAASDLQVSSGSKMAGGTLVEGDLIRSAPSSVRTVFRNSTGGAPHVVTTTLAGLTLTEYGSATGVSVAPHSIYGEIEYDGSNGAACTAYGDQAARDYYLWRLVNVDVSLPGIREWTPTGAEDRVEWSYQHDKSKTRIIRPPFQELLGGSADFSDVTPATTFGCNLTLDGDEVSVDVDSLAGDGLEVNEDDPCPKLQVVLGDGLEFDGDQIDVNVGPTLQIVGNVIDINISYFTSTYLGCGLEYSGGLIRVDNDALAGTASDTSLVPFGTCALAFDDTITNTEEITYQTNTGITTDYCAGTLVISKTLQTITDRYNAANILVDRVYGDPVTSNATIDICLYISCCTAETLEVTATSDPDPAIGTAGLEVDFTATPTGGVGPYTYFWDFDDGDTSSTQNPTHEFDTEGTYEVVVTVTDECGCTATDTIIVYVIEPPGCVCEDCPYGAPLAYTFTLSGGAGDFAGANGFWVVPYVPDSAPACSYSGSKDGWIAGVLMVGGLPAVVTVSKFGDTEELVYESAGNAENCCDTFVSVPLDSSVGTGTEPTLADLLPVECAECDPCCEGSLPNDLYFHVEDISGCPGVGGLTVHLTKTADTVWSLDSSSGGTSGCDDVTGALFNCETRAVSITFGADNAGTSSAPVSFTCSPFQAVYEVSLSFSAEETCCSGTIRITVNGTP